VSFNVPAGRIDASATIESGRVVRTTFRNVPSFIYRRDQQIRVDDLGVVKYDIAYGGAFYAVVDAKPLSLALLPSSYGEVIRAGVKIKRAIANVMPIEHPFESDLSFLYGTIFVSLAQNPCNHSRNACVFADGELDRSATGSGVSARAALHFGRGELELNQKITIESILGSTMSVQAVESKRFGRYDAVVPEVSGTAHVVGENEWWFDPEDGFLRGFIFR
jgi:trans-L-3-hydroxyproline dehydratase